MVVAISNRAVLVVDPTTKEFLEEFPYTKLVTWGHSEKAFVIVSGDLIHQRKIYFKTNQVMKKEIEGEETEVDVGITPHPRMYAIREL